MAAVLFLFVVALGVGLQANTEAGRLEIEAKRLALAAQAADARTQDAWAAYTALGDTLVAMRDSLQAQRSRAVLGASRAADRFGGMEGRVAEAAADSARVVALVDSMVAAHYDQVAHLADEVSVLVRERDLLVRRVTTAEALIAAQADQIVSLEQALETTKGLAQAYAQASPSLLRRIQTGALQGLVGLVLGVAIAR
jgi:chromosome segregation ATPase